MLNILMFALPLSSTQIVISGLAGVSLMYFTGDETNVIWFRNEAIIWCLMPLLGLSLSYGMSKLIKKHIYQSEDATQRVVKIIPYQITLSFTLMWWVAVYKNYLKATNSNFAERHQASYEKILLILMFSFPTALLPLVRFYLLRRARNLDWVGVKKRKTQVRKEL